MSEYLAETEVAMTKADTGEFLFDDLRQLAASHAQQKIEFEKLIPENISLGLFVVSSSTQSPRRADRKLVFAVRPEEHRWCDGLSCLFYTFKYVY